MKRKNTGLNFKIDKLTNSIENAVTGETFDTQAIRLTLKDAKKISPTEWVFDWHTEIKENSGEVFKLITVNNSDIIHGLLSIEDKGDHIFMRLVESANFNKGKNKVYLGVAGNLIAYACKVAMERGYEGYVAFDAKTALIPHYRSTIGATLLRGQRMYIDTNAANKLISRYFKGEK